MQTNIGEINSLDLCFVSTTTDLANKVLISGARNSCSFLLNGYWYNFTAGRLSVISECIPDIVVRISGSDLSNFLLLFQVELRGFHLGMTLLCPEGIF